MASRDTASFFKTGLGWAVYYQGRKVGLYIRQVVRAVCGCALVEAYIVYCKIAHRIKSLGISLRGAV